ncbi:MAG: DsrE/DsrF/DrsH-like family protein [Nitrososphaerota archaeon]|nr:DsrE/DsrF/DrsH-like family protein [Nitrososphaerota archaeon]
MAQLTQLKAEEKGEQTSRLLVILSKSTIDMVYPALMIANTGATMGKEVHMFFTFWGLDAVNRTKVDSLKVASVGNPGMPMPNILGMIPGMTAMATRMMKGKMAKAKQPTIHELFKMAKDLGVKLHACSTTMEAMNTPKESLIDEVDDVVGAATMLSLGEGGQIIFI